MTNKAVSRWETGSGFPDVDSMLTLSAFFEVSVNELLYGSRSALPEAEADSPDKLKKTEARVACDSLDLSIKKRRYSKIAAILAAALTAVVAFGAVLLIVGRKGGQPERPQVGAPEYERWFSPLSQFDVCLPYSTAKLIDLQTGKTWTACPDPECRHAETDENCFFNRSVCRTEVYAAEYIDNHVFFVASKKTDNVTKMKLYDHNMETGEISEIYTYALLDRDAKLFSNRSTLFFTALDHIEGKQKSVSLWAYSPENGSVTLIEKNADFALQPDRPVFADDYYISIDRYDKDSGGIRYRRRSFDGSKEEFFDALPDGTPLEPFGYKLENGLFSNVFTGCVYIEEENRILALKTARQADSPELIGLITPPAAYGDSFYYQTKSGGSAGGDNEVYIVNRDGGCRHYSIECEYRFVIIASYENVILGRLTGRMHDNGSYTDYSSYARFIRIDLDTGETSLYDASIRSDTAYKTFVSGVTLNDE